MSNGPEEKETTFESGLARLEEIVKRLESGEQDLDASLSLFEAGVRLTRQLGARLDEAEKKLEVLLKDDQGRLTAMDLKLETQERSTGKDDD